MAKLFKTQNLSNWEKVYKVERQSEKNSPGIMIGIRFKDINYIFSLRAAFYGMHQFFLSH